MLKSTLLGARVGLTAFAVSLLTFSLLGRAFDFGLWIGGHLA